MEDKMAFISLQSAADRLGVSVSYLRDMLDRTDRIQTVLDPDPSADFWTSTTSVIPERDIRTYEHMLARRRFVRFREKYADVLVDDVELTIRPGWKSLLERVAERLRWMPPAWNARLRKAREKSGYMTLGFEYDSGREDARNEIARLREEIRLSSLSLCEECGRNGRFRYSPSRSLALCDRHARLAAPTLPGDGEIADPASDGASINELPSA
ncbi:hypothetical protein [Rhizobium leguminosarum]|uniref:hypothetical protein n=1 Tax=Rhizobium leguminosarum TaxID=384 RepID=UPI001C98C490|nr:hypothetical protein [Rhizobium leguminosarum]MBY5329548.1 hypothetical protein [Rhizobium leguminosarum]